MSNHEAPTDSLALFLRDAGRSPLLTAAQEVKLTKLVERGDAGAKRTMIESNLRLVVSIAKVSPPGPPPPRPDPGGDAGADACGRQVRLAPGLQVLHVCDLVDQPSGDARACGQGAHDPDAGAHGRAGTASRPGGAHAFAGARAGADIAGGGRESGPLAAAGARGGGGGPAPRPVSISRSSRRRVLSSET